MPVKVLLNAIHDVVKWVLHVVCTPIVAMLKAVEAGLTHLREELEKL